MANRYTEAWQLGSTRERPQWVSDNDYPGLPFPKGTWVVKYRDGSSIIMNDASFKLTHQAAE